MDLSKVYLKCNYFKHLLLIMSQKSKKDISVTQVQEQTL